MRKPKLLLDENIGFLVIRRLRREKYDVLSVLEEMPGAGDSVVLAKARREKRIVVTLDQDFGGLVFRDLKKHAGIILLRLEHESAENIAQILLSVLKQYGDQLSSKFVVASEDQVRIR